MDRCAEILVHPERVAAVQRTLPGEDALSRLADWFRLLADPARLRTLLALKEQELCVCDIAALHGLTVSAASHQLRLLRTAGLVHSRREGKMVFYRPADRRVLALLEHELDCLTEGV